MASLGVAATVGHYDGSESDIPSINPWTGFVQSGDGFSNHATTSGNKWFANFGTVLYDTYAAILFVPNNFGCGNSSCGDQFMWAGIGGFPFWYVSTDFGNNLLQSGFHTKYYQGGPTTFEFVEFVDSLNQSSTPPQDFLPPQGFW